MHSACQNLVTCVPAAPFSRFLFPVHAVNNLVLSDCRDTIRETPMKAQAIVIWTASKVAIVLALFCWGALQVRRFDLYFPIVMPAFIRPAGIALMIAGGLLALNCGAILSTRGIGSRGDRLFPKEFVAFGPFRYGRNPMSLGAVMLLCGLALAQRSPSMLLLALLIFLLFHLLVVYVEEPGLETRFGESYRSYKHSVHRWLPSYPRKAVGRT